MAHVPTSILCLSGGEIGRLVEPAAAIAALAEGFVALTRGEVQAPPRPKVDVPAKGFALAMLAWAPGKPIGLKTVNVFHHNAAHGLPSHQAIINLFDAETGVPVAVLDGAVITGLRTAAAAVLTVREMARPEARIATIVGAGVQARDHARLLSLARPFTEIRLFARNRAAGEAAIAGIPNAALATDLEAAVRSSDVVCLTTSAEAPVIEADWVKPGTHVTSVGFAPPGTELPATLIERAAVVAVEAKAAFQPAPVGCVELAGRDPSTGAEIGEILLGQKAGRTSPADITLYKSMGNAMEDLVVAHLAYEAARRAGIGQTVVL